MSNSTKKPLLAALLMMTLPLLLAQPGLGIWRTLLNDHFDNDQSELVQRWPWNTPFQNPNIGWHYNPLDPWPNAEGDHRSDYSWGWQNFIYNVRMVEENEFSGCIWCAYTNLTDINNPRWPEDEDYMNGQRAWVWWGPMDLRQAVAGSVNWWMNVDLENFNYDSLSVVVFDDDDLATIPGNLAYNQQNFRTNQAFGVLRDEDEEFAGLSVFKTTTDGWVSRTIDLNDLRTLNANGEIIDSVSYLGRRNVWVGWVWHTNVSGIVGKGAFIDDVIVGIDDGLFDLSVDKMQFGYPHLEQVEWSDLPPTYGEDTRFRLDWFADGNGETPEFHITCSLDGQVILDRTTSVVCEPGRLNRTETEGFWTATSGQHTVRWTLDPTDAVEESIENNNTLEFVFEVPWIPAPTMVIEQPDHDTIANLYDLDEFELAVFLADSNETDTSLTAYLYWTKDTSGFGDNPEIMFEWNYITHRFGLHQGLWTVPLDLRTLIEEELLDTLDQIYIGGFVNDAIPANVTFAIAPGKITVDYLGVEEDYPSHPNTATLLTAYPSPFNGELRIDYTLARPGTATLKVFDIFGREVTTLLHDTQATVGKHTATWVPSQIGAGVYIMRLDSPEGIRLQKVVFTP